MNGSPAGRLAVLCLALVTVCLAAVCASAAGPTATVTITSPEQGITIATRIVTVEAEFAAAADTVIGSAELAVDGTTVDARRFDPPASEGSVSFTWLARDYAQGKHQLVVRAIDSDGRVAKGQISVVLKPATSLRQSAVRITSPAKGETVSGVTTITAEVDNPALAKYVIFLVDDVLKAISNVRPFVYEWDTTRYLNGLHVLTAQAYAGGAGEAVSVPIRVTVDNPSGATAMREPSMTMSPVAAAPSEPPARASEVPMPPPVRAESPTPILPDATLLAPALAVPGTAPFVSPSGDLITPPLASAQLPSPVEIAALPTSAGPMPAPSTMVAPERTAPTVSPVGTTPPVETSGVVEAESALSPQTVSESAASPAREPASSPLELAMLPLAPERQVEPASQTSTQASTDAAAAEAPQPTHPAEAEPPPTSPPAEHASAPSEVAAAQEAEGPVTEAVTPMPSDVRIAMLPPKPLEAAPAPRVSAEPIPTSVTYVVRAATSLARVSAECGVPVAEIARANGLESADVLKAGQRLSIPSLGVALNGKPIAFDVPAVLTDGRAVVPFRAVIEEAGGKVTWNAKVHKATASAAGHSLAVAIGSDQATVDGSAVTMSQAAQIRCGRTVVPLRFIGDALDLALQYSDGIIHVASAR